MHLDLTARALHNVRTGSGFNGDSNMRVFSLVFTVLSVFFANSAVADSSQSQFYAICITGEKIGYAVHTRTVAAGIVTTTEKTQMTIGRAGVSISVGTTETCIETVSGEPIGFESMRNMGGGRQKTYGRINKNGKLEITTAASGRSSTQVTDWPADTVMAEGFRLIQLKKGLTQGTSFNARIFSPELLSSVDVNVQVGPRVNVDLFGRVVNLVSIRTLMQVAGAAITSTSYVNEKLDAKKIIIPMMGIQVELTACDKQFALSADDVVDFVAKLLVQSPVPLAGINSAESAGYYLKPTDKARLQIPSTDNQTVSSTGDGRIIVTVKPVRVITGGSFPYRGKNPQALAALEPAQYLESNDPKIIALARQAVGETKDAAEAAVRIRSFVTEYITRKDFSVGYATASEVAASRQGDCSEHAVLLAAMCRAAGIPARVVSGLLYVEEFAGRKNVFGGHAWVQVYVDNKWVGLDASRAGRTFGPGYITLATGNGDPADFFSIISTLGNFTIEKVVVNR